MKDKTKIGNFSTLLIGMILGSIVTGYFLFDRYLPLIKNCSPYKTTDYSSNKSLGGGEK